MVNPKWLLLAPPCVWALVGLIALAAPGRLMDLFPLLWPLNDAALLLAACGLFTILMGGPGPLGPVVDEWAAPPQGAPDEDVPVEALLLRLARALAAEERALTGASRP